MAEIIRLRLEFDDPQLISPYAHATGGSNRCWFLIYDDISNIYHLSKEIIERFDLEQSCPHGIILSMDDFVLPTFGSVHLVRDKDVICVKKREGEMYRIDNEEEENTLGGFETESVENQRVEETLALEGFGNDTGVEKSNKGSSEKKKKNGGRIRGKKRRRVSGNEGKRPGDRVVEETLALEEFEKENGGGYESENECDSSEEEEEEEEEEDAFCPSSGKTISKKRKSSKKLQSKKKKKIKTSSPQEHHLFPVEDDDHTKEKEDSHHEVVLPRKKSHKKPKSSKTKVKLEIASIPDVVQKVNGKTEDVLSEESDDQLQENGAKNVEVSHVSEVTNKLPSRSARRKKAKRKWLRELANSQKKEQTENHFPEKPVDKKPTKPQQTVQNTDMEVETVPVVIRPGHIRFEPLDEDDDAQQRQDHVESFQWNGTTSKKKGQKWGKEKTSVCRSDDYKNSREDFMERLVVEEPKESFQWNGTTSKKKGQKWGKEKTSVCRSDDYKNSREDFMERLVVEEPKVVHGPIDFEKLKPFCILPKEGNVLAYRLVELSSSWCPELSPFRVGKVLRYDSVSNTVVLAPVPEYPNFDENADEDETSQQAASLYGEDGSLEIDFTSLLDVRIFDLENSGGYHKAPVSSQTLSGKQINGGNDMKSARKSSTPGTSGWGPVCTQTESGATWPDAKNEGKNAAKPANGGQVDVWEQLSDALSEKKTQLSQRNGWNEKERSTSAWAYRAMRSSALGPTMALLRSGKEL